MKEVTWLMAIDDDLAEGFLQHNQLTQKFGTHRELTGVVYNPLTASWRLGRDLEVNYIAWAVKA